MSRVADGHVGAKPFCSDAVVRRMWKGEADWFIYVFSHQACTKHATHISRYFSWLLLTTPLAAASVNEHCATTSH